MKRINYIANGFLAIVAIVLFAQCAGKKGETAVTTNASEGVSGTAGMKIAYVNVDTLLTKYNFWNDLNEMMLQKEETMRATLTQKGRELETQAKDFQTKLQNNAYTSRERAEQENARLVKKQQELQELQAQLQTQLANENQKNSLQLRDSINSFLKQYNKDKGYDLIISNTGFDNLLYANEKYDITNEIVEGLNKRYVPSASVKK